MKSTEINRKFVVKQLDYALNNCEPKGVTLETVVETIIYFVVTLAITSKTSEDADAKTFCTATVSLSVTGRMGRSCKNPAQKARLGVGQQLSRNIAGLTTDQYSNLTRPCLVSTGLREPLSYL